jgi:vancomycin aglycone glucosyltransferase
MAMRASSDLGQVVLEACRAHGRRVILSRGWADLAPGDELGDVVIVGDVNHQALFPRVAAVVHHGGAGTTTTAALAGAPQVVVPQIVDQPHWARRVAELGIGAAHDGPVPTSESLAAALEIALAPKTSVRAAEVAGSGSDGWCDGRGAALVGFLARGPASTWSARPARRADDAPCTSPTSA